MTPNRDDPSLSSVRSVGDPRTPSCQGSLRPAAGVSVQNEVKIFDADVLARRREGWIGGKAVLVDRSPRADLTKFAHCLKRHAIAMHIEGANTKAILRYDRRGSDVTGSTIGQVMFIPAHGYLEGLADFPSKVRHLVLTLDPQMLACNDDGSVDFDTFDLPYRRDIGDGVIARQMRALQRELDRPGPLSRLFVESLSCEIVVRAVRICAAPTQKRALGGLAPRRMRLIKDYIEANLTTEITLSELAAIAGVSRSHFSRTFRVSAGIGAHRYIIRQRIEQAKKLLASTDMPIAEVAIASGFADQSHLTVHFSRETGTTPGRFRKLS